jgi:hypothetical protein
MCKCCVLLMVGQGIHMKLESVVDEALSLLFHIDRVHSVMVMVLDKAKVQVGKMKKKRMKNSLCYSTEMACPM